MIAARIGIAMGPTSRSRPYAVNRQVPGPRLPVDVTGEPGLAPVADEVTTKLQAAIDWLAESVRTS